MRKLLLVLLLFPLVVRGDQAPGLAKGFAGDKVYDFSGIDSINTFNGNLNLRIPIGPSYPVGGNLAYSLSLSYNSKVWDYEDYANSIRAEPSRRSNAGMGWILSLGRFIPTSHPSNDTHNYLYESPDGGDHGFHTKLHESDAAQTLPPGALAVGYTRDGTYLRMTDRGHIQLDHPTGMVQRFDKVTGNLSSMTDGAGNWVFVTYVTSPAGTPCLSNASWIWKITDSKFARTNYICFEDSSHQYNGKRVERVVLAAPPAPGGGARTATWQFLYEIQPSVRRGCHSTLQNDPIYVSGVPRLTQLILPDGSRYSFRYNTEHTNTVCESGTLSGLTLPTGASIDYIYRYYEIPVQSESCDGTPWRSFLTGVHTRTVSGPNIDTGTWTYTSSRNYNGAHAWCQLNNGQMVSRPGPAEELMVTVTDPQDNVTEHLYSVWPGADWHFPGGGQTGYDPSPNGFVLREYGQPFTRMAGTGSGSGYLSRRTYTSAGYAAVPKEPKRSFFLQQERDDNGFCGALLDGCILKSNQRTKFARTMFHDDGDKTADVTYSDFDGLGHYRTTVATGSFGDPITTTTTYNKRIAGINPDRGIDSGTYPGSFNIHGINEPWVLNTAPKVSRLESGHELVSQQCFDPASGSLLARRSLKNSSQAGAVDLLALFEYTFGDMIAESYFGGDTRQNAPTAGTLCEIADSPPTDYEYRLTHGYTAGVRTSSRYAGVSFLSLNRTVNPATGLPLSDTDVSGAKTTTYEYDTSWRLTKLSPPDDSSQSIVYTNASGTSPARAEVTTGASQQHYLYDGMGRVWREKRLMPGISWALRETRRNNIGWTISTSEFETMTGGELTFAPSHLTVFSDFDPFGRPGKVKTPDNKSTTLLYAGKRTVTRVHNVATSATGESTVQDTEVSDPHGRLVRVNEDANGVAAFTHYTYNVTGKLSKVSMSDGTVTQIRNLNYDGRGLLGSESHPESGTTTYDYDSRGHVRKRQTPTATLTFAYDPAERVTLLSQTGVGVLKEFTWDRANSGTDYSFGKLDTAKRHNRILNTDVVVTETYKYQGDGGRISSRETNVSGYGKFTDGYTYDDLGQTLSVTYPWCNNCSGLNAPSRTVDNVYSGEYLTRVGGYTSQNNPMTYHANGMLASMQHLDVGGSPGPTFTQTLDHGMPRPAQISVSGFCEFGLQTPLQPKTVPHGQPANLTVEAPAATSFQWYERTGGSDSLLTGQTTATLTVTITSARFFWVRVGNGSCTVDSNVVQVSVGGNCSPPGATITAASSMEAGSFSGASVTQTPGATYAWSIPDGSGTITSPASQPSVTFTASCAATAVTLQVTVTASCGSPSTATKSITVWKPSAVLSGSTTINPGQTATLTVSLTGTGPWTIGWSDGATTTSSTPAHSRDVSPSSTTMYTLTFVRNAWNCNGTTSGSATVTVTTCSIPSSTITAASSMEAGSFGSASVPFTAGAFYAWTIPDGSGTITSASNQRTVTFAASCHATAVTLEATVTASCGASSVSTKSIAIVKPTASLSGSTTIPQGGSATLTVTLTGTAPWSITWSDGATTTASASPSTRIVSPTTTTLYTLTSVRNAYNCAGTTSGAATVTVTNPPPPSPTDVVATATSATTIRITWLASGSPDSFNVERRDGGGAYVVMAYNAPMPFNDNAPPDRAYQYRVIAIKAGEPSAPSVPDLATTVIFENVLTPGSTLIRAQHIQQLRTAINAVRATAGFAPATFTDPNLTGLSPKLEHVTELKTALDQALPWLDRPPTSYTGPPPARGGVIRAEHLTRLRDGVQ